MKYFAIIGVMILLIPVFVSAQVYVRGGIGYGLSLGSGQLGTSTNSITAVHQYEGVYGSFGKGFNFVAALGATINQNFKGELGISYTTGGSIEEKDVNSSGSLTTTYSGSMFSFMPGIIVSSSISGVEPYARINAIIAFPSLKVEESGYDNDKSEFTGNIAVGFGGGIGIQLPLQNRFSVYGELAFSNISWGPSEEKYTNMPSGNTVTIQFKDSWNENEQNTSTTPRIPFGHVGINIGLLINL
ncbi:MAG: outer membrane beta-barrel protein [Ignavibacteriales bacterium]|nr:outer membrane beta-barrel protein [Ignavibacteriales bacterium]